MDYVTSVELFIDLKPRICEMCLYTRVFVHTSTKKFIIRIEISDWVTPSGTTTNQQWPSIQLTYITHDPTLRAIKKEIYGSVVVKCKKELHFEV